MRTRTHAPTKANTRSTASPRPAEQVALATIATAGIDRLVRLPEVRFLTGLGKSSIYEGVKAGTFPQAVRVTDYAVAWRKSEVDQWIASRPSAAVEPTDKTVRTSTSSASRTAAKKTASRKSPVHRSQAATTKRAATARKTRA